jgi:hypothetical protein
MTLRWNCRSHISGMFQSSFMYFVQRLNVPSLRFSSHFEARLWHNWYSCNLSYKSNRQVFMKFWWYCCSHIIGMLRKDAIQFIHRVDVPSFRFSSHFEARLWHNWYSCNLSYKRNRQVFMKFWWYCCSHILGMFWIGAIQFIHRVDVPSLRFSSHFEARLWHSWYGCDVSYKRNRQVFMKFWWHCCSHIFGMFQLASSISLKLLLQPSNKKILEVYVLKYYELETDY